MKHGGELVSSEIHAIDPTLYGRSHIQVMPSSQLGVELSSRCEYAGHLFHFDMFGDDMLVRTVKDKCTYNLISPRVLSAHLPQAFVRDYVHRFDRQLYVVSFIPIVTPWSQNIHYW